MHRWEKAFNKKLQIETLFKADFKGQPWGRKMNQVMKQFLWDLKIETRYQKQPNQTAPSIPTFTFSWPMQWGACRSRAPKCWRTPQFDHSINILANADANDVMPPFLDLWFNELQYASYWLIAFGILNGFEAGAFALSKGAVWGLESTELDSWLGMPLPRKEKGLEFPAETYHWSGAKLCGSLAVLQPVLFVSQIRNHTGKKLEPTHVWKQDERTLSRLQENAGRKMIQAFSLGLTWQNNRGSTKMTSKLR